MLQKIAAILNFVQQQDRMLSSSFFSQNAMRILLAMLLFGVACASAAEPRHIFHWEQNVPNAFGNEEKDKPKITVWFPDADKSVGSAVVICPGGGYGFLAMDHEGKQIAEWLNSFGVTAAVLDYRHRGKGYGHPNPMLDAQRAIQIRFGELPVVKAK